LSEHTSVEHGTNHSLYKSVNMSEWLRTQTRNLAIQFLALL